MPYRIDIETREGRAAIERLFNRVTEPKEFILLGIALSGERAGLRDSEQNELWLALVDNLLDASHSVKANYGDWKTSNEGGLLVLVDVSVGLRFEAEFLELAEKLGDRSEEAILTVSPRGNHFDARLLWQYKNFSQVDYWRGGE